jgi:hypothetical protein
MEKLSALRTRVESAVALKPRRRAEAIWRGVPLDFKHVTYMSISGLIYSFRLVSEGSSTANLFQAFEEYLPSLLGLLKEIDYPII